MTRKSSLILASALLAVAAILAGSGPAPLAEPGKADARLSGYRASKGLKVQVVADGLASAAAMAFDDSGSLFVVERAPSDRSFETWETINLPEGGTARLRRHRKGTLDVVKRLKDQDGDGIYESSEVAVDGAESPSSVFPWKNSLYLTCVGRLERWSDEDGDGRFETRAIVADGFSGTDRRWLGGLTIGPDGWLYLTSGDGDNRVVGPDGSRVDLVRNGGIFRARPDGSNLKLFAMGLRNPTRSVAFDSGFGPIVADGDPGDGSTFQGTRLVSPVEGADYGWRTRGDSTDFDRASDGGRPGKLGVVAKLGRGEAPGLAVYNGMALPTNFRDLLLVPDAAGKSLRGLKLEPKGGTMAIKSEATLLTSDDAQFRPGQVVVGPDGTVYVLDPRRILRLTWEGDGVTPALSPKPNNWQRITTATNEMLCFQWLSSLDYPEAERAQRELVERATEAKGKVMVDARSTLLAFAANKTAPLHARLLGLQGARQLWNDDVEAAMLGLLGDDSPEVRRLSAQSLDWEPKSATNRLVAKLMERLEDPDPRAAREAILAVGRHSEPKPQPVAANLVRWLLAHPKADPVVRDGVVRGLERLGDAGVEEVALAIRTRKGTEREASVLIFNAFRSAHAADQLSSLVRMPDLSGSERVALIRQLADIPVDIPVPTSALADFVARRSELEPSVKLAALEACRLSGNPASGLVLALLDDDDEAVRIAATRVAAHSRPPGAMTILARRLVEPDRSSTERLAVVKALRAAPPATFAALDAAYLAAEEPAFRRMALRSMAEVDRAKALPALEAALSAPDPSIRSEAVRVMGDSPGSALNLAKAYSDHILPGSELPAVLAALRKHGKPEHLRWIASIEADAIRARPLDPSEVRARALNAGDPWAGMGVFSKPTAARCSACHKPEEIGGEKASADKLIKAVLRHPRGQDKALRPDRAPLELTPDELGDLVAFLLSRPAVDSLKHGPKRLDHALAIGPFAPGADKLRVPLDKLEPGKAATGQDGSTIAWKGIDAANSGVINLRGQLEGGESRAYLAASLTSAHEQSAAIRFGVEGSARVYLNGSKVAEVGDRDPSDFASMPELVHVTLKAGSNLILIAVDHSDPGDARVILEVASPEAVEWVTPAR